MTVIAQRRPRSRRAIPSVPVPAKRANRVVFSISVSDELHSAIVKRAAEQQRTRNWIVVQAIKQSLGLA